eukprot:gnl/TRDRNA2_/TRDRNA2_179541_c0_seq1.p1 gnl/TRDRNA2_/TRDRNA2_179541_c0~~gnl/TRDRNA2_/TRDRNA2_179541_c0_seq1.p1  ORF type:complete len:171 (-),score=38.95 gnl/TRDRNA2_/TRDRNA2_179541_c0_seq1:100-612(-)
MGEEGSWDNTIEEWILYEEGKYAFAGALAQIGDGQLYAAAPVKDQAGWGFVYKEDHEEEILQEDGETTKKVTINEAKCLKALVDTGKVPAEGLWIGGQKYSVTQSDLAFESNDGVTLKVFMANRPKMGVHIVATDTQIVLALYDEAKGHTSGNCKRYTVQFAEYLKGLGY